MTTTTAPTEGLREDICPPWCEGHEGRWQDWDRYGPEDVLGRDHSLSVNLEGLDQGGFSVTINAFEVHGTNELQPPTVDIYSHDVDDITPTQARDAMALIQAQLERIERWQA
jgi:hypothetical protein